MSLVIEACLNWDGFDAEFFIVAFAGFVKIGDIVSDVLFTKDLADFNNVFDDLDLEEIKYKPPINELIVLSVTFTIIGIVFDLYKAFYTIKERRKRKANGVDEGKGRKHSFVVEYIEESVPSWMLQRIGFTRYIVKQEESRSKNEEKEEKSIDEAVTVADCDATAAETNVGIKSGGKKENNDVHDTDSDTSKTECEHDQEESDDGIEEEFDEWKWWKRLNLIFEEIPQLMILIFFYQKVILVRDCDSVKEKIELCDQNLPEARMLKADLCGDPYGNSVGPPDTIIAKSIPKNIIQTAPNDQSLFDPQWINFQASLHNSNPDFEFYNFNDDEALRFIDEHFEKTELPSIYRNAPRSVMRADLFRLASVSVLGGFYMDMDMLAKQSFGPLVDAGFGAVFPREWKKGDSSFVSIHSRQPSDEEERWQVGNYAFAAIPNHPFVVDALEEAMHRCQDLTGFKDACDVTDFDVLYATGPYMLSEVYHSGRKVGAYGDVYHILGDDDLPYNRLPHGENNWHKFGPYAEHMLSHSWVTSERNLEYQNIFSDEEGTGEPVYDESYNTTFTEQDPFVKPITVLVQLYECPQYGSWSISSINILAQYNYYFLSHNGAQINITKVAYVNENTPLAFYMTNYMYPHNESCGVISYAIFEGANVTNTTALILQGNPNFQSGWNDPIWEYFTLYKISSAPSVHPSISPSIISTADFAKSQSPQPTSATISSPPPSALISAPKEEFFMLYPPNDPRVKPITVFIQLYECVQFVWWSIFADPSFDSIEYASYKRTSYGTSQSYINHTDVVYIPPSTPLVLVVNNAPPVNDGDENCGIFHYKIYAGMNEISEETLITQDHYQNAPIEKNITDYFTLGSSLAPASLSSFNSMTPSAAPINTETFPPTQKMSPSKAPTISFLTTDTFSPTARFPPVPISTKSGTPPPTRTTLTLEQQQICENKKYYVAACGEEQQKYTHNLFVSSITSIVFTSLNTIGIFIGWFRSWRRKRRILAKRRNNNDVNYMVAYDYNLQYQNIQHLQNLALYFQYEKIKQDEFAESLPEGVEKDEAKRSAAIAENNSLYYMQISSELYEQAQNEEFVEFW